MFARRALRSAALRVLAAPPEDFGRLIRELRPQQVMLETCEERLLLSRQEAAKDGVLSHVDAISSVHGGLSQSQLRAVKQACEEAGASLERV